MNSGLRALLVVAVVTTASSANAAIEQYSGSVGFQSDLQPNQPIALPSFDTQGGLRILNSVLVEVWHDGSVNSSGDNDDPFQGTRANARISRQFSASGPGVFAFGNKTITSDFVDLAADNGDLGVFDPTAPDGVVFGSLAYTNEPALGNPFSPAPGLYATPGPGLVNFDVDVLFMANDNQFDPVPPDSWQLEVENPSLTVHVRVTYDYVPEPASLALLAIAGALGLRRRR